MVFNCIPSSDFTRFQWKFQTVTTCTFKINRSQDKVKRHEKGIGYDSMVKDVGITEVGGRQKRVG